ncbi:MAG: DsbC family protein [Hylemonella sp.]|uniref:DsbC family protein n=1 Tax=Hylemonella sp. TaxID=2066020 RepID=UPI0022C475F7|nr:DsbC family protein [Hylemonella sp.]MCZ8252594.1 DsbC family protein [Hylemonella sp.]
MKTTKHWITGLLAALLALGAGAQEATIRKNLAERLPQLPAINEVSKTPIPGLYEIRVNDNEIYYTDAEGHYLIQGQLIDVRQKRNLTEERVDKLLAIDFKSLPFKDAFTVVRGNGQRKMAIFSDPNCGYCKRIERDLAKLDNVTIHVFLYPVLGPGSTEKSKLVWCAKERSQAWLDLMLKDQLPSSAACDVQAIQRNLAFGQKLKVQGTPTLFFADGSRVPGAIDLAQIERQLAAATR